MLLSPFLSLSHSRKREEDPPWCKTRDRRHLAQMHTPTEGGASPQGSLSLSLSSRQPLSLSSSLTRERERKRKVSRAADAARDAAASPRSILFLVVPSISLFFFCPTGLSSVALPPPLQEDVTIRRRTSCEDIFFFFPFETRRSASMDQTERYTFDSWNFRFFREKNLSSS